MYTNLDLIQWTHINCLLYSKQGLHWWLSAEESASNARDIGLILGSGKSPGEENGNPLQFSCLGNSMDKGAWQAIIQRVAKDNLATKQQHVQDTFASSVEPDLTFEPD